MLKGISIMMKWGGFLALLGCSSAKDKMAHSRLASESVATIGPLEIHCDIERTASGAWYNQGGKPGYKDVTSYFSVKHQGKLVPVTTASGTTTHFWQALVLKDAPMPAVLVATHSVYLITDENGQLTQKSLDQNENDFAKYQWLDGENGRPGKQQKVYLGDDSKSSRFLSGGRFLLVNTRMLLDVQSLATYPIDNNSSALVQQLNGYNAFGSEVVALSPGKTQLVLIGYRRNQTTNRSEYALVAINFVKNQAYAIPFDRTETQFLSIWTATPAWLATYFDWIANPDGTERLSLHTFKQRPYWTGRWNLDQGTDLPESYELSPVLPGMIAAFMDCIGKQYAITDLKVEGRGDVITNEFTINGAKLTLYFITRDKRISLHCDDKQLLKRIGEHADKELAKGNFQKEFGQFDFD